MQVVIGIGQLNRVCLCGSSAFERVEVERPNGSKYVTAFLACRHCGVMYHAPRSSEPVGSSPEKHPLFIGREAASPLSASKLSPEAHQELMEAVKRANKGKRKGLRG